MLSGGKLDVEKLEDLNWDSIREAVHVWKEVDDFLTENPDMMQKLEVDRSELSAMAAFLISLGNRARTLKAAATDQLAQKLTEGSQRTIGGGQSSDEQVNTQAALAKAKALLCNALPATTPILRADPHRNRHWKDQDPDPETPTDVAGHTKGVIVFQVNTCQKQDTRTKVQASKKQDTRTKVQVSKK